ncbi:hypothetical protein AFFFEF_03087 [Methylorubrum extorquens]
MENANRGFVDAVRRSMRQVREVISAAALDPALLTAAERIQYEGYLRREEADAAIRALAEAGVPIRRIGQRLSHSRKVVRAVLRGERTDVFRIRQSSLEAYLLWLDAQWDQAAAKRPRFGDRRSCRVSEDRFASSGNGRRDVGAQSRPTSSGFSACRRREPWHDG